MKRKFSTLSYWSFFIFVLILFLCVMDLFHAGLPVTHDGQDHVARIANFYASLQEGIVIPRWAGNLNWGYGHPILMFLYPLPSYFASVFRLLSFSFVSSVKLVFGVSFILSGFTMYLWMKEVGGERAGLVAGLLYTLAPYRFVDLYVRGAIGEHVAFIFPPLLFLSILKLSKEYSASVFTLGVVSLCGLILSHNAISLMFLPIYLLYAGYLFSAAKNGRMRIVTSVIGIGIWGFVLSAFFWLPAFFEGKYTLRDIVTASDYATRFVAWKDFFWGAWSYGGTDLLSKQIGLMQWVGVGTSISMLCLRRFPRAKQLLLIIFILIFFSSLFLMTTNAAFLWQHISLLPKFQFPWRFLSVSVFAAAVIGGLATEYIMPKKWWVFGIVALLLLLSTGNYMHAQGYRVRNEHFYTGIYNGTTDTGESSPIWSVRFMEKRPNAHLEVISGSATIVEQQRSTILHQYTVTTQNNSRLLENTLYFPGWQVYVDGKEAPIQFQDPQYRGLMTFVINKGVHQVVVIFKDTKLRSLANMLSLGGLFILLLWLILSSAIWRRFR